MKVLLVAAFLAVAGAASVSQEKLEFQRWKLEHGKSYNSVKEESQREMIWQNNRRLVLEHNKLADQGLKTYRLDMTYFADMDNQEYQTLLATCLKSFNRNKTDTAASFHRQDVSSPLPNTVDWRTKGYVTAVKNQQSCGSCWAFSATGALEGQMFKKTRKLVSLSEQQLVDCSSGYGNNGCHGGWPTLAFKYVIGNKGLQTERSYPYMNQNGTCRFNPRYVSATCSDVINVPSGNETALQAVVSSVGPVSVCIDARDPFHLYKSGVYNNTLCSSEVNHAVLVVGYGTENGQDYWLVKNSWGDKWGERGYIKMARNNNNMCAIASYASYPVV